MTIAPITDVTLKEDDLIRLEDGLGVKLQPDYRRFMLEHNGGKPSPCTINFWRFTVWGGYRKSSWAARTARKSPSTT